MVVRFEEQRSCSGESAQLSPMWLGLIPARCQVWIEFVVGSPLLRGFFSVFSGFNSPSSNSTRIENLHENQLRLMWFPL